MLALLISLFLSTCVQDTEEYADSEEDNRAKKFKYVKFDSETIFLNKKHLYYEVI